MRPRGSRIGEASALGQRSRRIAGKIPARCRSRSWQRICCELHWLSHRDQKERSKKWEGDNAKLTFAPGENPDALSKTIHERMPEFLDVLIVTSRNEIFAGTKGRGWPYIPPLHEIFSEAGEYLLSVSITGPGIATAAPQLRFTWTKNWETSRLRF